MGQSPLFNDTRPNNRNPADLGSGLTLEIVEGHKLNAILYRHGVYMKAVDLTDRVAKRLFVVELVESGACQSRLATALSMSRQTIHNYLEIKKHFGREGLIQGYTPAESRSLRKQRELHKDDRISGNKAKLVAEIRQRERAKGERIQLPINFSFGHAAEGQVVEKEEQPFIEVHDWEETRYAGVFAYLIPLITEWKWLPLVMGYFGEAYKVFMIFLLMAARNIRSIEQLKHVRLREAGIVVGISRIPGKAKIWECFYDAARKQVSRLILADYFRYQIRRGCVGIWLWFTDGHLLPYTGKDAVHSAYNTQRRMPVPGRTSMVTCDGSGRVVDFEIQEGKGDLRGYIVALGRKWEKELPDRPVMVFDREGNGVGFFSELVLGKIPFVTWEKHADLEELAAVDSGNFKEEFKFNGKEYSDFEEEKPVVHRPKDGDAHSFTLRRICIWNKSSGRRVSGLAWTGEKKMSTADCARAILSRWGASENTFKHLNDRHPLHYHPGFTLVESDHQMIVNPEIKKRQSVIKRLENGLSKLYKKLAKAKEVKNTDGTPRQNSKREQLRRSIEEQEAKLNRLKEEKLQLPAELDVSMLEDYRSFKQIDNEGKYLFDFVTTSVWNARKQMVDWLRPLFNEENELVDLFYAITNCHGWIKSTQSEVIVRLEPLQQPKRRLAQEQLCRKLTSLGAQTPTGKWLIIEVGESPS